jgi:hypothetical protein
MAIALGATLKAWQRGPEPRSLVALRDRLAVCKQGSVDEVVHRPVVAEAVRAGLAGTAATQAAAAACIVLLHARMGRKWCGKGVMTWYFEVELHHALQALVRAAEWDAAQHVALAFLAFMEVLTSQGRWTNVREWLQDMFMQVGEYVATAPTPCPSGAVVVLGVLTQARCRYAHLHGQVDGWQELFVAVMALQSDFQPGTPEWDVFVLAVKGVCASQWVAAVCGNQDLWLRAMDLVARPSVDFATRWALTRSLSVMVQDMAAGPMKRCMRLVGQCRAEVRPGRAVRLWAQAIDHVFGSKAVAFWLLCVPMFEPAYLWNLKSLTSRRRLELLKRVVCNLHCPLRGTRLQALHVLLAPHLRPEAVAGFLRWVASFAAGDVYCLNRQPELLYLEGVAKLAPGGGRVYVGHLVPGRSPYTPARAAWVHAAAAVVAPFRPPCLSRAVRTWQARAADAATPASTWVDLWYGRTSWLSRDCLVSLARILQHNVRASDVWTDALGGCRGAAVGKALFAGMQGPNVDVVLACVEALVALVARAKRPNSVEAGAVALVTLLPWQGLLMHAVDTVRPFGCGVAARVAVVIRTMDTLVSAGVNTNERLRQWHPVTAGAYKGHPLLEWRCKLWDAVIDVHVVDEHRQVRPSAQEYPADVVTVVEQLMSHWPPCEPAVVHWCLAPKAPVALSSRLMVLGLSGMYLPVASRQAILDAAKAFCTGQGLRRGATAADVLHVAPWAMVGSSWALDVLWPNADGGTPQGACLLGKEDAQDVVDNVWRWHGVKCKLAWLVAVARAPWSVRHPRACTVLAYTVAEAFWARGDWDSVAPVVASWYRKWPVHMVTAAVGRATVWLVAALGRYRNQRPVLRLLALLEDTMPDLVVDYWHAPATVASRGRQRARWSAARAAWATV